MKNQVKRFTQFITEMHHSMHHSSHEATSQCCGSILDDEGNCTECGEYAGHDQGEDEINRHAQVEGPENDWSDDNWGSSDQVWEKATRKQVLKAADEKYPNLDRGKMKKGLEKMKGKDFKEKAEKNFGWADKPEAAAAAYMRKATHKEPKDN